MPFLPDGTFTRVHNWQDDRDNGIDILADRHDEEDDNFAQGLSLTFLRDGSVEPTQDLPMGGRRFKNGGAPVDPDDFATKQYVDDNLSISNIGDYLSTERTPSSAWLKRDGAVKSQADYPELAALLGTKYAKFSGLTPISSGTASSLNAICHGNGLFVAVGAGGLILTSPTGAPGSWTARTSGTTENLLGVCHGGGYFVAVGANGKIVSAAESNVTVWTTRTSGVSTQLNKVIYAAGRWVAVGQTVTLIVSFDVANWAPRTVSGLTTDHLYDIAYGNGRFIIAGGQGGTRGIAVASLDDAASWSWSATGYEASHISIAYGKGDFIMSGGGKSVFLSAGGEGAWSSYPLPAPGAGHRVGFALRNFFAIGSNYSASSYTAERWDTHSAVVGQVVSIADDGTTAIAVGASGFMARATYALDIVTQFQLPSDNADIGYIKAL